MAKTARAGAAAAAAAGAAMLSAASAPAGDGANDRHRAPCSVHDDLGAYAACVEGRHGVTAPGLQDEFDRAIDARLKRIMDRVGERHLPPSRARRILAESVARVKSVRDAVDHTDTERGAALDALAEELGSGRLPEVRGRVLCADLGAMRRPGARGHWNGTSGDGRGGAGIPAEEVRRALRYAAGPTNTRLSLSARTCHPAILTSGPATLLPSMDDRDTDGDGLADLIDADADGDGRHNIKDPDPLGGDVDGASGARSGHPTSPRIPDVLRRDGRAASRHDDRVRPGGGFGLGDVFDWLGRITDAGDASSDGGPRHHGKTAPPPHR